MPQEDVGEGVHPCVDEEQRWVVLLDDGHAGYEGVSFLFEEGNEFLAYGRYVHEEAVEVGDKGTVFFLTVLYRICLFGLFFFTGWMKVIRMIVRMRTMVGHIHEVLVWGCILVKMCW